MAKYKVGDKLLQVSGFPNAICYTEYSKGPSTGIVQKLTPQMYRVEFPYEGTSDIRISIVERDFCMFSEERQKDILELYTELRTVWSKLFKIQYEFLREDSQPQPINENIR